MALFDQYSGDSSASPNLRQNEEVVKFNLRNTHVDNLINNIKIQNKLTDFIFNMESNQSILRSIISMWNIEHISS